MIDGISTIIIDNEYLRRKNFSLFIEWRLLMDELTRAGREGMAGDLPWDFAHFYPD